MNKHHVDRLREIISNPLSETKGLQVLPDGENKWKARIDVHAGSEFIDELERIPDLTVTKFGDEPLLSEMTTRVNPLPPVEYGDFDPATCVTAKQMRTLGFSIPETIPEEAWLPKDAISFTKPRMHHISEETLVGTVDVRIQQPFRWVTTRAQVDPLDKFKDRTGDPAKDAPKTKDEPKAESKTEPKTKGPRT